MRSSASRPRKADASRLVTWAWSGAPSTYVGAGIVSMIVLNIGSRSGLSGIPPFSGISSEARPVLAEAKITGKSSASWLWLSSSRSMNSS